MFSLISHLTSTVSSYFRENDTSANSIDDVINHLENSTVNELQFQPKSLLSEEEEDLKRCFFANGKITSVNESYVIINGKYVCEKYNINPTNLAIGDIVHYLAYEPNKDKDIIISKIVSKIDKWQNSSSIDEDNEIDDEEINCDKIEKQKLMTKVFVEKVERREKRLAFAGNICINLDNVSSEFVPLIGDWVKIICLTSVNFDSPDLSGEVVNVNKIEPVRSKLITGCITNFDINLKTGSVDKKVIFHRSSVKTGYVPSVGDSVICDCIESDQGQFSWRAISVVPINECKVSQSNGFQLPQNIEQIEENKNGIEIDNNLTVDLNINEEKQLKVNVKNTSYMAQMINNVVLAVNQDKSQLCLIMPHKNSKVILNKGEIVTYYFKCRAKFAGKSVEIIQFCFHRFQIARKIVINVICKPNNRNNSIDGTSQYNKNVILTQTNVEDCERIPGIKPGRRNFFAKQLKIFKVPQLFWDVVLKVKNQKLPLKKALLEITDAIPSLNDNLTFANYKTHFHNLLYLEEIEQKTIMQMYKLDSGIFRRVEDYLVLEVPGLSEKRPSLIVGDKVLVSFNWKTDGHNRNYEGFIHIIKNNLIFVKFNQQFHDEYNDVDCKVAFETSTNVINHCHGAINNAATNLGQEFLFPVRVIEKKPQYILKEVEQIDNNRIKQDDEQIEQDTLSLCNTILKTRNINWFNKNLNEYQKNAIKNIITGIARPLPYVIFGPPGTGKTVTICETVLQILTLIPDSRIMIATPSNSSANLIAERLLDWNVLRPGDLVRLVANYYISSDAISKKLLPYCAVTDLSSSNSKDFYDPTKNKYNSSSVGRHRITIGTCTALGNLNRFDLKPGHFTHILVDEAGQATEPEIMIPLSFIKADSGQVILAGDPLQLGPTVISKYGELCGYSESFLVRLLQRFPYKKDAIGFIEKYDPRLVTKLLINYRSLPEILELPNSLFYESDLIPAISPDNSREAKILEILKEDLPQRVGTTPPAIIFHGVDGINRQDNDSPSWYNSEEAAQVYLYMLRFYEKGFTANDIGIITPYKKQVFEIKNLLCELNEDIPKVGTVEEFQGQERNIIILSTVRTMSELLSNDIKFTLGFVSAPQRLNVAITRARALLIIIGNPYLLSKDPYWRNVLYYCNSKNSYTGCNIQFSLNKTEENMSFTQDDFV